MNAPIPPKDFKLSEHMDSLGPLPKCKHGMIANLCDICIELDRIKAGVKSQLIDKQYIIEAFNLKEYEKESLE